MVSKNQFISDLRNRFMPKVDDPRKKFLQGLRSSLTGTLGKSGGGRPSTSKPRKRSGVRTGRPVSPSDG